MDIIVTAMQATLGVVAGFAAIILSICLLYLLASWLTKRVKDHAEE